MTLSPEPTDPHPDTPATSPAAPKPRRSPRLSDWAPSRTQVLVLVIGLLAASNIALWIALRNTGDTRPVTVVAVRQMTQDYVRKITSPTLSEPESVLRANLFVSAAQDELRRLVPANHLVLARECVLSGAMTDITAALRTRVEARLAQDPSGLTDTADLGRPGARPSGARPIDAGQTDPMIGARLSAARLLSPAAEGAGGGGAQ
jgi:hypothetical protein